MTLRSILLKIGDYTLESASEEGVTIRYVDGDTELAFSHPISAGEERFDLELPAMIARKIIATAVTGSEAHRRHRKSPG